MRALKRRSTEWCSLILLSIKLFKPPWVIHCNGNVYFQRQRYEALDKVKHDSLKVSYNGNLIQAERSNGTDWPSISFHPNPLSSHHRSHDISGTFRSQNQAVNWMHRLHLWCWQSRLRQRVSSILFPAAQRWHDQYQLRLYVIGDGRPVVIRSLLLLLEGWIRWSMSQSRSRCFVIPPIGSKRDSKAWLTCLMEGIEVCDTLLKYGGHHVLEGFIVAAIMLTGTLAVVRVLKKSVCVYIVGTMFAETTWSKAYQFPKNFPSCCHRTGSWIFRGINRSCLDYAETWNCSIIAVDVGKPRLEAGQYYTHKLKRRLIEPYEESRRPKLFKDREDCGLWENDRLPS